MLHGADRVNIADEIAAADAGLVVQCDVMSIADGISRVLADPALAARLAANGHALVHSHFTWDAALDRLLPIYENLIDAARRGVTR